LTSPTHTYRIYQAYSNTVKEINNIFEEANRQILNSNIHLNGGNVGIQHNQYSVYVKKLDFTRQGGPKHP